MVREKRHAFNNFLAEKGKSGGQAMGDGTSA